MVEQGGLPVALPLGFVRARYVCSDQRGVNDMGASVMVPIGDRYYGLRDFTISNPDGFGIRFASVLA